MAEQSQEYVPVQVDEDGYLRVRLVTTKLNAAEVIEAFLASQDPALLGDMVITQYPDVDPVTGTLRALVSLARSLDAD
jgi:hypothetical protein